MSMTKLNEKTLAQNSYTGAEYSASVTLTANDSGVHFLYVTSTNPEWSGKEMEFANDVEAWLQYAALCDFFSEQG